MNNPTKKPIQPIPPKQTNPAVDELVALRQEMSEFRKDFAKFNQELSRKVTIGISVAVITYYLAVGFFSVLSLVMPR